MYYGGFLSSFHMFRYGISLRCLKLHKIVDVFCLRHATKPNNILYAGNLTNVDTELMKLNDKQTEACCDTFGAMICDDLFTTQRGNLPTTCTQEKGHKYMHGQNNASKVWSYDSE